MCSRSSAGRQPRKIALTKELEAAIRACLCVAPQAPAPSQRMPLTELRAAASAAGWSADVHAATVGDNDWWTFMKRLRQAAADGAIPFFGRRYLFDHEKDSDPEPLLLIPTSHFAEFGFDVVQLAEADNYNIFTCKLEHPVSAWKASSSTRTRAGTPCPRSRLLPPTLRFRRRHDSSAGH